MDDVLTVLREEFEAEDGSFLLRLRTELVWDRAAFSRLEAAMRAGCETFRRHDELPRWLAEGYYYLSHFVPEWTSHANFPSPEPETYYTDCLERIRDLADWYFHGVHSYLEPHDWAEL